MEKVSFITSLVTFYLKGSIEIEQHAIKFKTPNTILGLIPLGCKKETILIQHITSANSNFKLLAKDFFLGILAAILGLILFNASFLLGLIVLLIGASMIINSFQISLRITAAGKIKCIYFLIFDKKKAERAEELINIFCFIAANVTIKAILLTSSKAAQRTLVRLSPPFPRLRAFSAL